MLSDHNLSWPSPSSALGHGHRSPVRRTAKRDVRRTGSAPGGPAGTARRCKRDHDAVPLLQMVIEEAVKHLPDKYRAMALMRIEGYEVAEIAARTGRSPRTVERVLQQFRQRLARTLELGQDR